MKTKSFFILLFFFALLNGNESLAQTPSPYQLPETYRFDYSVEQMHTGKRHATDSSAIYFFYTKSGDYAAARINGRAGRPGNLFFVLTRDGITVIFDEQKKNITIVNLRKLVSGLSDLTKWIRMDSLITYMRKRGEDTTSHSVKTGKTKPTASYTSEEFTITGRRGHQGSVWLAHVDFNTMGDYAIGALGANWIKMISYQRTADPLFQALTQSKTLVTAINLRDSTGERAMEMHTISINTATTTVPTAGYTLNDYSNMTLPEIFQAEVKKRN